MPRPEPRLPTCRCAHPMLTCGLAQASVCCTRQAEGCLERTVAQDWAPCNCDSLVWRLQTSLHGYKKGDAVPCLQATPFTCHNCGKALLA